MFLTNQITEFFNHQISLERISNHQGKVTSVTNNFGSMWSMVLSHTQTFLDLPLLPLVDLGQRWHHIKDSSE